MRSLQQTYLIHAAERLGVEVSDLLDELGRDLVIYTYAGKSVSMLDGRYDSHLTAKARIIADDKQLTKLLLKRAGFSVPNGIEFTVHNDVDVRVLLEDRLDKIPFRPVVLKPLDGTEGQAVAIGLDEISEMVSHVEQWRSHFPNWIIEEKVKGPDLRMQVIGGQLVAACVRNPAFVIGDGSHSLLELIEAHRQKISQYNPANRLDLDNETRRLLSYQELSLNDIPYVGQRVVLKETSNMSQGGVAIDVTDVLHQEYSEWAQSIARVFEFGLELFAIDAICPDPRLPPYEASTIIEINPAPDWLHHTFSENRTHDIPGLILSSWFDI